VAAENKRLKSELATKSEELRNVKADFESFRQAAALKVVSPANLAEASLEAPAETDLELPAFLDRRLTDGLSEVDRKAFVTVAVAWEFLTRAWANASPTVRKHFETVVPGSAQAPVTARPSA
jgi:hypothetical protein